MITQSLSNLIQLVDRSIFLEIDRVATESGYSVDRSVPGIRDDQVAWQAAELDIIADKGFVVGIRSSTNAHDTGNKKVPRIVFKPQRLLPGELGNPVIHGYESDGLEGFERHTLDKQTSDYFFEISIHAQKSSEFRVIQSIVSTAINHRKYLSLHSTSENFIVTQIGYLDDWDENKGTMDTYFQYRAHDFMSSEPLVGGTDIAEGEVLAPMKDIKLDGDLSNTVSNLPLLPKPTNLVADRYGSGNATTVDLTWDLNSEGNETAVGLWIKFMNNDFKLYAFFDPGTESVTITGLQLRSNYEFYVVAMSCESPGQVFDNTFDHTFN